MSGTEFAGREAEGRQGWAWRTVMVKAGKDFVHLPPGHLDRHPGHSHLRTDHAVARYTQDGTVAAAEAAEVVACNTGSSIVAEAGAVVPNLADMPAVDLGSGDIAHREAAAAAQTDTHFVPATTAGEAAAGAVTGTVAAGVGS